jgi:hypothetical protein
VENGQGYCAACNHTKQTPGWHTEVVQGPGPHTVDITTPTGQHYQSRAPDPPRSIEHSPSDTVDPDRYPRIELRWHGHAA